MGLHTPKPYRKLSRITGKFEWVYPQPEEFKIKGKVVGGRRKKEESKNWF